MKIPGWLNYNKKLIILLLAFSVPLLAMVCIYICIGIYPFGGNNTLFTNDMSAEYIGLLSYAGEMIKGNAEWGYTFGKAFGGDLAGLWGYIMASPFNLVFALLGRDRLHEAVLLVSLLKTGCCGFTMNLYLNRSKFSKWESLIFSSVYALMAYNISYQQNIMWLDGVILLPLVIWGIERQADRKKISTLYIFSLAAALVTHYYIGYMICIFSVLYFLVYQIGYVKAKEFNGFQRFIGFGQDLLGFAAASLLAGGMSAFATMPIALSMRGGKAAFNVLDIFSWEILSKPGEILLQLLPIRYDLGRSMGRPNIYCGIFILVFCVLFFITCRIPWKQKLAAGILLIFLFVSLIFKTLDRVWHATAVPAGFPFRYSFVMSFVLILLAYQAYLAFEDKWSNKTFLKLGIGVLCILELMINGVFTLNIFGYDGYQEFCRKMETIGRAVQKIKESDDSFYRIGQSDMMICLNDPMLFNYRGLSSYSSCERMDNKEVIGNLGINDRIYWLAYHDQMPVGMESFLGVKYVIADEAKVIKPYYEKLDTQNGIQILKNPYVLPFGVLANSSIFDVDIQNRDYFVIQNGIWKSIMDGGEGLYQNIPAEELYREDDGVIYEFIVDKENEIYTNFFNNNSVDIFRVLVNGRELYSFQPEKQTYCMGKFRKGDIVTVEIRSENNNIDWYDLYFYHEDMQLLKEGITKVQNDGFQISEFRDTYFKGNINNPTDEEKYLLLSVPYDDGWEIYLDGVLTKAELGLNRLICLNIPKGEHEVILQFRIPGLTSGFMLLLFSLVCLVGIIIVQERKARKRQ